MDTSSPTRIFVVDDHPVTAEGLCELLGQEQGIEVCGHAPDGDEAMAAIGDSHPDLVIVDITLKTSSGLDLVERLTEQKDPPRVLVVSMHDESLFAERSIDAGAMGYVSKEVPVDELLRAVRQVADGRIYLSSRMTQRILSGHRERQGLGQLSDRELEVFGLIGRGLATRDIARLMGVSVKTVETHRERIKRKLGIESLYDLIRHAVAWTLSGGDTNGGILPPAPPE